MVWPLPATFFFIFSITKSFTSPLYYEYGAVVVPVIYVIFLMFLKRDIPPENYSVVTMCSITTS